MSTGVADASDLTLMPRPLPVKLPGLHYWRTQRRLSQLALALQATLTARTIHALEHGSGATPETVRRLADALDVPPSDLLRQPPPALWIATRIGPVGGLIASEQ